MNGHVSCKRSSESDVDGILVRLNVECMIVAYLQIAHASLLLPLTKRCTYDAQQMQGAAFLVVTRVEASALRKPRCSVSAFLSSDSEHREALWNFVIT
jgi:hypothetical protein